MQTLNAVRTFSDAWKSWWNRRARLAEFDGIGAMEAHNVAQDLNTSVSELRTLASQDENSADLLQCRLADLKIDPATIERGVMRDLQRCCSQCGDKVLCAHELEDRPNAARWPKYCPNEHTIEALAAEKKR